MYADCIPTLCLQGVVPVPLYAPINSVVPKLTAPPAPAVTVLPIAYPTAPAPSAPQTVAPIPVSQHHSGLKPSARSQLLAHPSGMLSPYLANLVLETHATVH
jgi:hypothetical protein